MTLRVVAYVDGTNFCAEFAKTLREPDRRVKDGQVHPGYFFIASDAIARIMRGRGDCRLVRSCWYSSFVGGPDVEEALRKGLHEHGFTATLYKREQGGKEKGVDISIARDMLADAFRDNIDIALILAGDNDYIPLVEEVKRCGVVVFGAFWPTVDTVQLRRACDQFQDLYNSKDTPGRSCYVSKYFDEQAELARPK